jgi:hypothetical protein
MKASPLPLILLALAVPPAQAQMTNPHPGPPSPVTIASSLSEILSLATLGAVTTQPQVTQSGADYLVRLPLHGLSTPADAAVTAVAHPLPGGILDIASITFPSSGTVESTMPDAAPDQIAYSIGDQTIHARVDPSLAQPSTFAATLGAIKLRSEQGETHSEQQIDRYTVNGTLLAEALGQLSVSSATNATNWHLSAHAAKGFDTDSLVRTLSGHVSVDGLNRAQGTRLMAAVRALTADAHRPTPGQPRPPPTVRKQHLRDLVDATAGLLTRFQAAETLNDVHFTVGSASSGTIGHLRVHMAGDAADERVNARIDIGVDGFAMSTLSPAAAAYVPHHVDIRSALSNLRAAPLMALLRTAVAQDDDPAAVQARLTTLLADPAARVGIESVAFDAGPLSVTGSMRVVARAGGQTGADIHVSAVGVDALIAQAQQDPAMRGVLPMVFLAKGMGRPRGDAIVWDIALGGGPVTVNGVPFGQSGEHKR